MSKQRTRRAPRHDARHFYGVVIMLAGAVLGFFIVDQVFGVALVLRYLVGGLGWFVPGSMILLGLSWAIAPSAGRMMGPLVCSSWSSLVIMSLFRHSGVVGNDVAKSLKFMGPHFPMELGLVSAVMGFFHLRPLVTGGRTVGRLTLPDPVTWGQALITRFSSFFKRPQTIAKVTRSSSAQASVAKSSASPVVSGRPTLAILDQSIAPVEKPPTWHANAIAATLANHGVPVGISQITPGASVCVYGTKFADPKAKVADLEGLRDEIALALKVPSVRIAPVLKTSLVGVEVPNATRSKVGLREILQARKSTHVLPIALGKDVAGTPLLIDLQTLPHLLVAGTTGSGKTSGLHAIIASLLFLKPSEVQLVLVDPKRVAFGKYRGLPHLMTDVVTDMEQALICLEGLVAEMDRRYSMLASMPGGPEDIGELPSGKRPPYIVMIVDELNDLNIIAGKANVEKPLMRLFQLGRGAGIHVILATQYPSSEVITNQINMNVTTRLCFQVANFHQSMTVIQATGAETLAGNGDCILSQDGLQTRFQGCFVSQVEKLALVSHWSKSAEPVASSPTPVSELVEPRSTNETPTIDVTPRTSDRDTLLQTAIAWLDGREVAPASELSRYLKKKQVYTDGLLIELESMGVVGPKRGNKPRIVLTREKVS